MKRVKRKTGLRNLTVASQLCSEIFPSEKRRRFLNISSENLFNREDSISEEADLNNSDIMRENNMFAISLSISLSLSLSFSITFFSRRQKYSIVVHDM
jgi:hypothetical protein